MNQATQSGASVVAGLPTPLLLLSVVVALAAWFGLHLVLKPRNRWQTWLLPAVGLAVGTGAMWLVWQALARFLTLDGLSSPALTGLITAALIEAVVMLYRFERQVLPGWQGRLILGLRIAFIALLVLVLTEPTFTRTTTDKDERIVAVLIDDSASMDQHDPQSTRAERLELAKLLLPGSVPARVEPLKIAQALTKTAPRIAEQAAWLRQAVQTDRQPAAEQQQSRRQEAMAALSEAAATLVQQNTELTRLAAEAGLPPDAKLSVEGVSKSLTETCGKTLEKVRQGVEAAGQPEQLLGDAPRLATQLDEAAAVLSAAADQVRKLDGAAADAAYQRLTPEVRKSVDESAAKTRQAVANVVLSGRPDKSPGLAEQLAGRYTVKFYRFASAPTETTLAGWQAPPDAAANSPEKTLARQSTDLVSAVAKVQADVPRKLSGIIVVGDGRHNARSAVETAARGLSLQSVPVGGVLIGSTAPIVDAALTEATAPRSTQLGDRVAVRTGVYFAGLVGQTVDVTLSHDGKVIDTKKVPVQSGNYRTTVELEDVPKKTGLTTYEVKIAPSAGERSLDNNVRTVHLQVTDDPIRLLLVDDRPRWEYRYLRGLFAERDKSVRLQHVLIHPEQIEGIPQPPTVHASASRGAGEAEATALPAKPEDWFQFDAIILGDISPEQLKLEMVEALKRYVGERGGRLIVVAGQNYMPQAFASSPLAEMLPVVSNPTAPPVATIEPGYFVRLTPEGERNTITQLAADPVENRLIWEGFPEQHLRHPIHEATVDAKVLAFARPLDAPEMFRRTAATPEEAEQLEKQRQEFMQRNALIALKPYKAGEVLLLTFDGTWRFRYQVGDTRHHPFWGQVVRWAAANKLPAGNDLVRLGTDRPVYAAEETVIVRARLQDKNRVGVVTQGVSAVVREADREGKDGREVLRKKLEPIAGSPGMYSTDMGRLPAGKEFRVGLVVDDAGQGELSAAAGKVTTQIAVVQSPSEELVDLSADPASLETLAHHTKSVPGIVVGPAECDSVLTVLGPASSEIEREERYPLWHSWPVMIGLLGLAATEWIVRKKGGLT